MPRRDSKSKPCLLDMRLFDPCSLREEFAIQPALNSVARCVHNATFGSVVELLLTRPHLLEFVLSASDEGTSVGLTEWVLNEFPTSPDVFSTSLAHKILSSLSLSLLFVTYPNRLDAPDNLLDLRRQVELTPPALEALASFSSKENTSLNSPEQPDDDIIIKGKKSQRHRKLAKRAGRNYDVDSRPFDNLNLAVPTSSIEAKTLAAELLVKQKSILEHYLSILRRPALTETFKLLYIPENVNAAETSFSNDCVPTENNDTVGEVEVPSAYPMVQPMKAALYFDSAVGFGEWRILMSTKAEKNLREHRKQDNNMFKIIVKKIKELSNGHFSEDNHKRLTGPATDIPIFEAKMTRDTRLVYQVDCIPEYDSTVERQVLRIFGIYTHAQLDGRFWDSMGYQLSRKGKEYKQRCIFRNKPRHIGDNVISPATFPEPPEDLPLESRPLLELREKDLEELHSLLVLEKFVTFSQALLNSILADQDVTHVFNVSPQEKQIIEHTSSCYVLGRSGTGKTTTMLFKMLGIERSWQLSRDMMSKPRQIFVTQSRVLAGKVEEYFSKLIESLTTASHSPQELKRLAMNKASQEEGLIDLDDVDDWRSDLPSRFSLLEDEHFPMFITFDRLCALLEADIRILSGPSALTSSYQGSENNDNSPTSPIGLVTPTDLRFGNAQKIFSGDCMQQGRALFVSYDTFLGEYWNHFPQSLTKGLDPSLVFSEFMGVIKGSEQTLDQADGFLDRDAYENLSHRSQATFANQRENIYSLFLSYLKLKRAKRHYDAPDRTRSIVRYIRENGVPGQKVDFLYVDEVQDNLLIDSLLLRYISRNRNGLFWAGDTAQTISVGSAFKFTDLKALQYRIENQINDRHSLTTTAPCEFQLTVNYRSHGGIVNCAHSVVELISKFWPYSIDILAPERGIIDGARPIFFTGWDQDTVRYEQFLFGGGEAHIEFGAKQCILVRHDAARNKLREQVGNEIGLIMTLYESKGLEFDDVLLYNFFEDSTADLSQWRVVLNATEKSYVGNMSAPRFDDIRHASICSELKFLYVAITRSRKNLWVVDRSDRGEPMRIYWTARDQVKNCDPSSDLPQLAVSSSPEEWLKTAGTLFKNQRYMQAMYSYQRAGRPREAAVASAYYSREQARLIPQSNRSRDSDRSKAFTKAARAFEECAAQADKGQERQIRLLYKTAAECFVKASDEERAAAAYVNASEYTLAAGHYRNAGKFDCVVKVIQTYKVDQVVRTRLMDVSKMFFFKNNEVKTAVQLFSSDEDALEFTENYDLDIARATLLEAMGRIIEAAELHFAEGRTLEAIKLLLDSNDAQSNLRASQYVLEGFWRNLSFGMPFNKANDVHTQLLAHSSRLDTSILPVGEREEVAMFQAIISGDIKNLFSLGQKFNYVHHNFPAALLCLDHVFATPPQVLGVPHVEVASLLYVYLAYIKLFDRVLCHRDPGNNKDFQKVFGFQPTEDHLFNVPRDTFLYLHADATRTLCARSDDDGFAFPDHTLQWILTRALKQRMRDRVSAEDTACRETWGFSPCLYFVSSQCNRNPCFRLHIGQKDLTVQWYNTRIRIFLLQILIISLARFDNEFSYYRYWIGLFYEALNPPIHKLGSRGNLVLSHIPEAGPGLHAVRDSIRRLCERLSTHDSEFITSAMRASTLAFDFDKQGALLYLRQCKFVTGYKNPSLVRERGDYVIHELMISLQGDAHLSLRCGAYYMQYILNHKIPINIGVLCDYMDRLCGFIVMSRRFQNQGSLHNTMLPRTWLINQCDSLTKMANKETRVLGVFLSSSIDVLTTIESIFSKGSVVNHLTYQGKSLSETGFLIRNLYIFRICKCLCLLGYNIQDEKLRRCVLEAVNRLRVQGRVAPPVYGSYAWARTWADLAKAVRKSASDSSVDEMILLLHTKKQTRPIPWFPHTRVIIYERENDIRKLVAFGAETATALRAEAKAFVPVVSQAPSSHLTAEEEHDDVQEEEFVTEEPEENALEDVVEGDTATLSTEPTDNPQTFSEEHIAAVELFQRIYRRNRSKHQASSQGGLTAERTKLWDACEAASHKIEWPFKFYKRLFLGPLAHILLCLQGASSYAFSTKKELKKKMNVEKHHGWEDAMARQTDVSTLLKKTISLQKELDPHSEFHKKRDLLGLKERVLQVEQLMTKLPTEKQQEYALDLWLGVTAIARPRKGVTRRKAKPDLVVEDDY